MVGLLGSGDHTLKLWEVSTGRCVNTISLETTPDSVAFCPNQELTLIAVAMYVYYVYTLYRQNALWYLYYKVCACMFMYVYM